MAEHGRAQGQADEPAPERAGGPGGRELRGGGARGPPLRSGVLVIDKPAGPTSFDVVRRVRRALGAEKTGHAGTLDPAATGVLAVCVDDAVKLQQWLTDGDKTYEATVAFGAATTTEDAEGEIVLRGDASGLRADAIRAALPRLTGALDQVPPMYSAVRVGGRRLHEAARAGEEVDRAPRRVVVHALTLDGLEPPGADGLVRARLTVRCGKGTYVRTLAADLGRALDVPAHLAALRRTEASGFRIEGAIPLEEAERLGREEPAALRARLVSPADALGFLPSVTLAGPEARALAQGKRVPHDTPATGLVRALAESGALLAVCTPTPEGLKPVRVFVTPGEL